MAALVFAEPGRPSPTSHLVAMRCSTCLVTKPLSEFFASCAVYRRGSCVNCSRLRSAIKRKSPLHRKLESARARYKTTGGLRAEDISILYEREGIDWRDDDNLKRTRLVKEREDLPFGPCNVAVRWHSKPACPFFG